MSHTAAFTPSGFTGPGRTPGDKHPHDSREIASLLAAHLKLVQRLHPHQREASIVFRRDEVTALADLLGESTSEVIEKIGTLIGASTHQRAAMAKMFAAGALVIGLAATGSVFARGREASGSIGSVGTNVGPVATVTIDSPSAVEIDLGALLSAVPTISAIPTITEGTVGGVVAVALPAEAPVLEAVVSPLPPAVAEHTGAPTVAAPVEPELPPGWTDPALVDIATPPLPPAIATPPVEEVIEQPWVISDPALILPVPVPSPQP